MWLHSLAVAVKQFNSKVCVHAFYQVDALTIACDLKSVKINKMIKKEVDMILICLC